MTNTPNAPLPAAKIHLPSQGTAEAVEHGPVLMPKFDALGLITAVAVEAATKDILMVAYMNAEALARTIETGKAWYWSRSRGSLWLKGESSGQIQTVREIRIDCDQDSLILLVDVGGDGGCCHTGSKQCFYRRLGPVNADGTVPLLPIG